MSGVRSNSSPRPHDGVSHCHRPQWSVLDTLCWFAGWYDVSIGYVKIIRLFNHRVGYMYTWIVYNYYHNHCVHFGMSLLAYCIQFPSLFNWSTSATDPSLATDGFLPCHCCIVPASLTTRLHPAHNRSHFCNVLYGVWKQETLRIYILLLIGVTIGS